MNKNLFKIMISMFLFAIITFTGVCFASEKKVEVLGATYEVTENFLKMFGISNLDELPELPRYKLDENEQIVIDDLLEEKETVENDVHIATLKNE